MTVLNGEMDNSTKQRVQNPFQYWIEQLARIPGRKQRLAQHFTQLYVRHL